MNAVQQERSAQLAEYYRNPRKCAVCGEVLGCRSVTQNDAKVCANYTCREQSKKETRQEPKPISPGWRVFRAEHNRRLKAELEELAKEAAMLKKMVESKANRT